MVGLIGNLAKGALSKPKQKKVTPKQLVNDTGDKKERSKPKGSLVPSPSGAIVKIIDVKAPVKKDFVTGGDPALEQMKIINTKTFDIIKALKGQQDAKKKRAKSKKNLFQWMSRKNREEGREEEKGGGLKIPLVGKIAAGAGNLLGAILKTLAILFAGWLTKYLPQIIEAVRKFVDIVVKIVNFVKPIAQLFWDIGKWIVGAGTKLAAMLVGVKPDDATQNSIIQNLNAIQKRFPLLEAAFASFLVYKGLGGIKKIKQPRPRTSNRNPLRPNRVTSGGGSRFNRSRRLTRTRTTSQVVRNRFAQRFGGNASRARFGGNVPGRVGSTGSSIFGRGLQKGVKRLGLKMFGKGAMKILGKFAKVPIIGPLIVAVTQLLSGEPLGKALFMGVGAGLGGVLGGLLAGALGVGTVGFGAVLAPAIMILSEGIGAFVGELLYDGFLGKGWAAAGQKLKSTVSGFFKQTGEIFKSLWNWLMSGGLGELARNVGGALATAGKWVGGGVTRFLDNFFQESPIKLPDGGGVRWAATNAAKKLGIYDWLQSIGYAGGKDGQIDKFPNLLQLVNPFKYVPLLFKSFFPEKAEAMAEKKAAVKRGDAAKKNIFGKELSDEHQSEEYLKKRDSGQLPASKNADAISESASYDAPAGGTDTVIVNSGGGDSGGGGGGSSTPTIIGGDDFYKAALLNRKKSNLAKVWA
tara:strand:+ start:756 stop:2828 length:2073 start_codon:yes stop_codon:yes gene_type:complete